MSEGLTHSSLINDSYRLLLFNSNHAISAGEGPSTQLDEGLAESPLLRMGDLAEKMPPFQGAIAEDQTTRTQEVDPNPLVWSPAWIPKGEEELDGGRLLGHAVDLRPWPFVTRPLLGVNSLRRGRASPGAAPADHGTSGEPHLELRPIAQ